MAHIAHLSARPDQLSSPRRTHSAFSDRRVGPARQSHMHAHGSLAPGPHTVAISRSFYLSVSGPSLTGRRLRADNAPWTSGRTSACSHRLAGPALSVVPLVLSVGSLGPAPLSQPRVWRRRANDVADFLAANSAMNHHAAGSSTSRPQRTQTLCIKRIRGSRALVPNQTPVSWDPP